MTETDALSVGRRYMAALAARDPSAAAECWHAEGLDRLIGLADLVGPKEVGNYFAELFAAFPDINLQITEDIADERRYWVRWHATGTFSGTGRFNGIVPTGATIDWEGCDCFTIEDGLIRENVAHTDGATIARQLGMLPPQESRAERAMTAAFNAFTRIRRRLRG